MSEAGRLAYADRGVYMADPDFYAPPAGLLDPALPARSARALIRPDGDACGRATPGTPPERPRVAQGARCGSARRRSSSPSTSHLSIVDRYGQRGGVDDDDRGRVRQPPDDRGRVPAQQRAHRFLVRAGRRRQAGRQSRRGRQAAALVDGADDRLRSRRAASAIVTGSPGGSSIINYVAKTLVGDHRLGARSAGRGRAAQLRQPQRSDRARARTRRSQRSRPSCARSAHDVAVIELTSGVQAIVRTRSGWIGGADPRREGIVRGTE